MKPEVDVPKSKQKIMNNKFDAYVNLNVTISHHMVYLCITMYNHMIGNGSIIFDSTNIGYQI
jgi:carbonic anhydrase/acetyltransferase-like protein (isoleucine patch superfamily)